MEEVTAICHICHEVPDDMETHMTCLTSHGDGEKVWWMEQRRLQWKLSRLPDFKFTSSKPQ
jgi:hypothetical protein